MQEETLARLQYLVDHRQRVGLVVGPEGCGKSLMLKVAGQAFAHQGHRVVATNLSALTPEKFLWDLAIGLGGRARRDATVRQLWQSIEDSCHANRYLQMPTVVMIDDLDHAGEELAAVISRLLHSCVTEWSYTTMVAAAKPKNLARIDRHLLDQAALRIELEPWQPAEIQHYLHDVCGELTSFDASAVDRIYHFSDGLPRRIAQLVNLTLAAAQQSQLATIDAATIEALEAELTIAMP